MFQKILQSGSGGGEGLLFKETAICCSGVKKVIDKTGHITGNSEYFKSISNGSGNYLNIVFNKNCKIVLNSLTAGSITSDYTEHDVIADRIYVFNGNDMPKVDMGYGSSMAIIYIVN